ncbi:MAG: DUF2141 domain-containing protein [Sphingomonadaceae bacterium]
MALSLTLLSAATTPSATLELSVSGLRSTKGVVLACLTANAKFFPDCGRDPQAHKLKIAAGAAATMQFDNLAPGTYALAIIHDENSNDKMDLAAFLPREGFAFSRNPVIMFGPPRFSSAKFALGDGTSHQSVKMKYFL